MNITVVGLVHVGEGPQCYREEVSVTQIEAIAVRLPIIVADNPAAAERVAWGNGIACPEVDIDDLVTAIGALAQDRSARCVMMRSARQAAGREVLLDKDCRAVPWGDEDHVTPMSGNLDRGETRMQESYTARPLRVLHVALLGGNGCHPGLAQAQVNLTMDCRNYCDEQYKGRRISFSRKACPSWSSHVICYPSSGQHPRVNWFAQFVNESRSAMWSLFTRSGIIPGMRLLAWRVFAR